MHKKKTLFNFIKAPQKKLKFLFITFAFFLFFLTPKMFTPVPLQFSPQEKSKIESILTLLSRKEKEEVGKMIKQICLHSEVSYTMFGNKPMSFSIIFPSKDRVIGQRAWKNISKEFTSDKYIVHQIVINDVPVLFAANMELIHEVYQKNEALFLKENISYETLSQTIKEGKDLLSKLLENDLLLGILLGYGADNSRLWTANQTLPKKDQFPLKPFGKGHTIYYFLSKTFPVYFACDPSSTETKHLKTLYKKDQKFIDRLHKTDQILDLMLLKLTTQ